MIIGTIATASHLPRAMVMAKSVKENMPHAKVILCLVERETHSSLKDFAAFDSVVLAKDLGIVDFDKYIFKYNKLQASCSIKAKLMEYLMDTYNKNEKFIYLDSDIRMYSPLEEVEAILDTSSIVVTPHCLLPFIKDIDEISFHNKHLSVKWRELGILQTGLFNAGFFALRRTENAARFLEWWKHRMERYCYRDIKVGLFDDQRWLDLTPCFFEVHVLKHPGYNVAFWNLMERNIGTEADGGHTVNGQPLRFFHFSSVDTFLEDMIKRHFANPNDALVIRSLVNDYRHELENFGWSVHQTITWSYDYFFSGEKIEEASRVNYRENMNLLDSKYDNPYSMSNNEFSGTKMKELKLQRLLSILKEEGYLN